MVYMDIDDADEIQRYKSAHKWYVRCVRRKRKMNIRVGMLK